MAIPTIRLNNGKLMPIIGLGTWDNFNDKTGVIRRTVETAIDCGYRLIDSAFLYGVEDEIGQGIANKVKDGTVTREELFITTKVWPTYMRPDLVEVSLNKSLRDLGLDYVDLLLVHWPCAVKPSDEMFPKEEGKDTCITSDVDYIDTWKAFEKCHSAGLAKSIGISNFNIQQVERLSAHWKIKPVVNQVECHPYLNQMELKKSCDQHGIILTAYSPLGCPSSLFTNPNAPILLKDPFILSLAEKYNKNSGQILIRYQVELGNVAIPKSLTPSRIKANIEVFDFQLSKEDKEALNNMEIKERFCLMEAFSNHRFYPF